VAHLDVTMTAVNYPNA